MQAMTLWWHLNHLFKGFCLHKFGGFPFWVFLSSGFMLLLFFFRLVSIFWQMTIGADEWNEGSEKLKENVSIHFPMSSQTTCPQIEMLWFSGNSLPRHLLCTDSVEASSETYWYLYLYSQQHSRLCGDSTIPAKPHAVLFLLLCTRHGTHGSRIGSLCIETMWARSVARRQLADKQAVTHAG